MTSNTGIENLFYHSRFPNGLALLPLPFYLPLGIVVMVIRIFFIAQLYVVLLLVPKSWMIRRLLLRVSGALSGLIVTQQGVELVHRQECKMIVSNHLSPMDSLAFESILPCFMDAVRNHIPTFLRWILKYDEVEQGDLVPSLVFPEGATTNGTQGLLKFSAMPFDEKNERFVAATITISRPYFVQISPSVLGSYWWSDFLWLIFTPYTHMKIRFFEPPKRKDNESKEDYSVAVQNFMAEKLGIASTKFDAKEKAEYTKRYFLEQSQRQKDFFASAMSHHQERDGFDSTVESMASQVKNVLPQVPMSVIRKNIKITKCVDASITNFLEGKVSYTPEQIEKTSSRSSSSSKLAANSFGKDSKERHLSFQERKKAFIAAARENYLAKHGLPKRTEQ